MATDLENLQQKFMQSPRRPEWALSPLVANKALDAQMLRMNAEDSHRTALVKAIRNGSLVPLDHALLPLHRSVSEALDLGQVFLATFRRYAAEIGIVVQLESDDSLADENQGFPGPGVERGGSAGRGWTVRRMIREEAKQSYVEHHYAAADVVEKKTIVARIENNLQQDMQALHSERAITLLHPETGLAVDNKLPLELDWLLTRDDVETFIRFARFGMEGKRDFLLDRKRRKGEGRFTIKVWARRLAAETGAIRGTVEPLSLRS